MNKNMRARVDLIDGFLGAGKTTFIKKYMKYLDERGISYMVLENEFGAAGVDASILGGNVRELTGGCICCGQKVNFHNLLIEMAGQAERIIVEPSGIFNADDFFDIMDSPQVREAAGCGMMVGIVDPFSLDGLTEQDGQVLYSELISCGAILLSRTDRADARTIEAAQEKLRAMLGGLPPVFDAREADFGRLMACGPVRRAHERMRRDHSTLFQSAVMYPEGIYDEASLRRAAQRLLSGEAGSVMRVKGTVRSEDGFLFVNAAGEDLVTGEAAEAPALNVIGRGLKRKEIRRILQEEAKA